MPSISAPKDPFDDPVAAEFLQRIGTTDELPTPGLFANFLPATGKGLVRGALEGEAALATASSAWTAMALEGGSSRFINRDESAGDDIREAGEVASDYLLTEAQTYRADPITTGAAGQIGNELAALVPRTIIGTAAGGPAGGALAAGLPAGMSESAHLQEQGVDADTADTAGVITGATTAVGAVLPGGGFVKGAIGDTAVAAVANVGLGIAQRGATGKLLAENGYADMAAQYDAFDTTAIATDAAFSLLLSGGHHLVNSKATDAALTNKNADNFARGDGLLPIDAKSGNAVDAAKVAATDALITGKPVNVAATVAGAGFLRDPAYIPPVLPPEVHAVAAQADPNADLFEQFADRTIGLESGGKANAKNPLSSATGAGQFIDSTWLAMIKQHRPDLAAGKDKAAILAMRNDPALSREMVIQFGRDNGQALAAAKLPVNAETLYLAHHFGAGGAVKMLRADPSTPIASIISKGELAANPRYKGKTVAQVVASFERRAKSPAAGRALEQRAFEDPQGVRAEYAKLEDSNGGTILNTDVARELSPEYVGDRTKSADVHEAASQFVKDLYADKLARPTPEGFDRNVLFTAGGTGAGKTTAIKQMGSAFGNPEIVYDTNMNTLDSAVAKVEQALAAGREVTIAYVYRDPVEALTGGAIPRAVRMKEKLGSGRTVPLEEHAKTHAGVQDVMHALAKKYAGDDRVNIQAIDNSHGKDNARAAQLASLPKVEQNGLREDLHRALDQARNAGLDEGIYRGFAGEGRGSLLGEVRFQDPKGTGRRAGAGDGRRPQQDDGGTVREEVSPSVTAAEQLAQDFPETPVLTGFDADGAPVYRTLADAYAEIQAEQAAAIHDAQAYTVGANCYLSRGP